MDGSHEGNWAPTVLGVGRDIFGKTWLSISTTIDNKPIDYQPLDYVVELVAVNGGSLSGKCKVQGGKYCSGDNYKDCNDRGCTVSIFGGSQIPPLLTLFLAGSAHLGRGQVCPRGFITAPMYG